MAPSMSNTRARRENESRVRSGCWKCRERRVKCPEQRPTCHHCQRLGLSCHYDIRLTWRGVRKSFGCLGHGAPARSSSLHLGWTSYDVPIDDWMFLNTTYDDFPTSLRDVFPATPEAVPITASPKPSATPYSDSSASPASTMSSSVVTRASPFSPVSASPSQSSVCCRSPQRSSIRLERALEFSAMSTPTPAPYNLSPFSLIPSKARLWDYFIHFITPRCALAHNPWQDVLLRLAVFARQQNALFDCIIAVASNQMQIVGHGESAVSALSLRTKALSSLRNQITQYDSISESNMSADEMKRREEEADQIMCSAVLMCFFEVSLDCLQSWKVHAAFACRFLSVQVKKRLKAGPLSDPLLFASAYFASHHALACTGDWPGLPSQEFRFLQYLADSELMQTLTGCPRWLMDLISDITDLAMHPHIASLESTQSPGSPMASTPFSTVGADPPLKRPLPPDVQQRRDDIERRLHEHAQYVEEGIDIVCGSDGGSDSNSGQMVTGEQNSPYATKTSALPRDGDSENIQRIIEVRRLATLLYLYSRIDNSSPYKPHMMRLTARFVELVPSISTRTNTLLWPLFIVATLGIRPEAEEERRIVLAKLEELLRTRQLGHVRKARGIIIDVWKARDLRSSDATKSWSILNGRLDTLSLA